jgi:hypothetical protein
MADTILDETFDGGLAFPGSFVGFGTSVVAGVGTGGSNGVASGGGSPYIGFCQTPIVPTGRCGDIAVDSAAIYSGGGDTTGAALFVFYAGFSIQFQLRIDVGSDHTQVQLVPVSDVTSTWVSAVGANPSPGGAYRRFRLRYRLSSLTETSPGVWTPNADGYMVGYVNGVEVVRADPITLAVGTTFGAADANQPDGLHLYPIGYLDNLVYQTGDCEAITGSAVFGVTTTVAATRAISFGLDGGTYVDTRVGTFTVHGDTWLDGDVEIEGDTLQHGNVHVEGDSVLDGDVTVLGTLIAPGVPGAPTDAAYVTLSPDSELSAERVLTAGTGITITDGGPGSTVTISATGGGGGGSDHYDCPLSDGDLTAAELIFASGACVIVQVPV